MFVITDHPAKFVSLPPHVIGATNGCLNCTQLDVPGFANYEAYVEHWETYEYEGDPGHHPDPQEEWEYVQVACTGNDEGGYAHPATEADYAKAKAVVLA